MKTKPPLPRRALHPAPSRTEADAYRKREKEKQRKQKQRRQKLERLEQEIEQLESKIEEIHAKLCDPEIYNDPSASAPLQQELAKLEKNWRKQPMNGRTWRMNLSKHWLPAAI